MNKHFKINVIPLEKMQANLMYTFNLNLKYDYKLTYRCIWNKYHDFINLWLYPHAKQIFYVFEASPIGKVHLHGTITFKDLKHIHIYNKKINKYPKNVAMEIDTIKDTAFWMNYILKQSKYHDVIQDMYQLKSIFKKNH